ncbi:glycoside hydrolase family 32 protein [Lipomyces orientalis]|uniref:Glycoside hydrolase family 32 protein n=1 Tax=Lipomyces orientalis TaxID=1233043 RepID=A0ACC3TER5_9ASCO
MTAASSDETLQTLAPSHSSISPTSSAEITAPSDTACIKGWRPSYHLLPPCGWMNDPCAPGYDAKTGVYYVSFQWNPNGFDWGDIAWGSATSSDMISWVVRDQPVLSPDMQYDQNGVWTGCFMPCRDDSLTYAYTSVSSLPINFTIPHRRGCESLSLAKSFDNGKTWQKSASNPILPGEPEGLDVTGWRDPFCALWPSMSKFLGLDSENTLFGIITGGIRHVSPTAFLYTVDPNDVSKWTYLGPITNVGLNRRLSRWSGDLGKNWEVANFLTLSDENDSSITREFLIVGTEGCLPDEEMTPGGRQWRSAHGQLWLSGSLQEGKRNDVSGAVEMTYRFGGHLDRGCLYAANSFFDPKCQRNIVWGWVIEEDLCDTLRCKQGWSGMLSMPRELFLQTLHNVVGASKSDLSSITSIEVEEDRHGSYSVRTLASRPYLPLTKSLRQGPNARRSRLEKSKLGGSESNKVAFTSDCFRTTRWELDCSFRVSKRCSEVGVKISNSQDLSRATTLMFEPQSETFTIERPSLRTLSSSKLINNAPEVAPHTLFTTRNPVTGEEDIEILHIQAWQDNSVLEVFVNSRTAISTRLYGAKEICGMTFFGTDSSGDDTTKLLGAVLWDDIGIPVAPTQSS